jgi:hypothetical protein
MGGDDLVVLRTFNNHFEADVAKSALDAADIAAVLIADDAGGLQPGLWVSEGVALLVRPEDAIRASEVLDTTATPSQDDP